MYPNRLKFKRIQRLRIHSSPSYHSGIPQVEGVPAEALWEAVGLLSNAVFVRFNGAVRRHRLPCWDKTTRHTMTNVWFYFWKSSQSPDGSHTQFGNGLRVPELVTSPSGFLHGFGWTLANRKEFNGLLDLLKLIGWQ